MSHLSGPARTLLVLVAGCTVAVLSFAAGAASSRSKSKSKLFGESPSRKHDVHDRSVNGRDEKVRPAAIATWMFGEIAVDAAKGLLEDGATALDALEAGITAVELDDQDQYFVGLGGLPNADGVMELDAAVMDGKTMAYGAVMAIRGVVTAFKAARLVMERSPHCVLAGEGATKFALASGVESAEALTDEGRKIFEAWRLQQTNEGTGPGANADRGESHDTIGMVCLDQDGNLAAGTSTSGWRFKHSGRVGDSPVVGAGLYCDAKVGAAVATGDGEDILRTCLSFLVVENMRAGDCPVLACKKGIARAREIVDRLGGKIDVSRMHDSVTVAVMAMSCTGEVGAASTLRPTSVHRGRPTFPLAVWRKGEPSRLVDETDLPLQSSQK